MNSLIFVFCFFLLAFSFMAFALHFSQYKRKGSGCCADGLEEFENKPDPCETCPIKEAVAKVNE